MLGGVGESAGSGGERGTFPAEFSLGFGNRQIIDAREPAAHEAIRVELPVLIPVGAIPAAGGVVKLILEPHGDAIGGEGPEFLLQTIVELARPFPFEKLDDLGTAIQEFGTVAPLSVLSVGEGDTVGVATVPSVLGRLNFLARRFLGEGREWGAGIHGMGY